MATTSDLLLDAFDRIAQGVRGACDGLDDDQLATPVAAPANTVAWLVWHVDRLLDDHVSQAAGREQLWTCDGWYDRCGRPFDQDAIGYGQPVEEAQQLRMSGELLLGYHDAAQAMVRQYVGTLTDDDLDRVVDDSFDPPVTLGVRLVSVVNDCAQHVGQAAFARGILLS